ncbi:MAG: hypothetical protein EAY68_00630 [Bacteroidetes bacterium]|nr:MAG: hypothetical protein EAY68_00630 [Bacteroidota bacterium]
MKKILVFTLLLGGLAVSGRTQVLADTATKKSTYKKQTGWGFMVAPAGIYTSVNYFPTFMVGALGAVSWRSRLTIGLFHYSVAQPLPEDSPASNRWLHTFHNTGIFLEYAKAARHGMYVSYAATLGRAGGIVRNRNLDDGRLSTITTFTPQVLLNVRLQRNIKLYAGGGIRFASDVKSMNEYGGDFMGLEALAGLRIGVFK